MTLADIHCYERHDRLKYGRFTVSIFNSVSSPYAGSRYGDRRFLLQSVSSTLERDMRRRRCSKAVPTKKSCVVAEGDVGPSSDLATWRLIIHCRAKDQPSRSFSGFYGNACVRTSASVAISDELLID